MGCIEELLDLSDKFLKPLSEYQASCIRSLHLSSVKEVPGKYFINNINISIFQTFSNLESLSIDYDHMNEQLLDTLSQPHRRPLLRLNVHVHSFQNRVPEISSSVWKKLAAHSSNLEVTINLLHFHTLPEQINSILNKDMPLTHFRVYFSSSFKVEILTRVAFLNGNTLKSLVLVDELNEDSSAISTFLTNGIDPLVMFAWRCKNLSRIKIIGIFFFFISIEKFIKLCYSRGI